MVIEILLKRELRLYVRRTLQISYYSLSIEATFSFFHRLLTSLIFCYCKNYHSTFTGGGSLMRSFFSHPNNLRRLQEYCLKEPKSCQQIAKEFNLSINDVNNYRSTKIFNEKFFSAKEDGIILILTNPLFFSSNQLSLLPNKHYPGKVKEFNETPNDLTNISKNLSMQKPKYKPLTGLKRAGPERNEAALKINRVRHFGHFDKASQQFVYDNTVFQEIKELHLAYINRTSDESLSLVHAPDGDPIHGIEVTLPNSNRFNNPIRFNSIRKGYDKKVKELSKKHWKATMVILTIDERGTLYQDNKRAQRAIEKFISKIQYRIPAIKDYTNVREYQRNGRLHFNVMFYGVNWLMPFNQLKSLWLSCNGGSRLSVHSLHKEPDSKWYWSGSSPADAKGRGPVAYLKKDITIESGVMHWIMNTKFWSSSRTPTARTTKESPKKKGYFLKGVESPVTGFRASLRKDAIALFTGSAKKAISQIKKVGETLLEHFMQSPFKRKPKQPEPPQLSVNDKIKQEVNKIKAVKLPTGCIDFFDPLKSKSHNEIKAKEEYIKTKEPKLSPAPSKKTKPFNFSSAVTDLLKKYG